MSVERFQKGGEVGFGKKEDFHVVSGQVELRQYFIERIAAGT
jgi:hypothetical protein